MADQWQQLSVQWRQWSNQWRSDHTEQSMVTVDGHTMVVSDGLINGGNGAIIQRDHTEQSYSVDSRSDHTVQVVGAIIQSSRWPISGDN